MTQPARNGSGLGSRPKEPAGAAGPPGLWSVILAAGGSSRLGRPKQLVRFRSRTLLARVVAEAEAITPHRVIVVVGADRLRLLRHLRRLPQPVLTAVNARWADGMAGSLATGLARVPRGAALILLADQPHIDRRDLRRLIAHWCGRPARSAASAYAGRVGVPAILPRRLFARVHGSAGDTGARDVLRSATGLVGVAMPRAAVDVDTESDVADLGG